MSRAILFFLAIPLAAQEQLTPAEQRGRQIYDRGVSVSGSKLEALLDGGSRVPASVLPCANCHGFDGQGRPEGGVTPSNITWDALTKPYGLIHPNGRSHLPYTDRLLKRAITMGIDPARNTLASPMPRFQLSNEDASDLVAYVKRLGNAAAPGITAKTIRIGAVLLPPTSNTNGIVKRALLNYFDRVNAEGGIFGRQIELIFSELPADAVQRVNAVRDFLSRQQVFAVMGDFTGAESGLAAIMGDTNTPAIPALCPFPETSVPPNKYVFYLDGGLKEELEELARFASEQFPRMDARIAIVFSGGETGRNAAHWLRPRLLEAGRQNISLVGDGQLPQADLVFWLRPEFAVGAVASAGPRTTFLIPGSSAVQTAAPEIAAARIFIAATKAPQSGRAEFDSLTRVIWDRVTASAAIATEAMKVAGRDLSRPSLLSALESFQSVQTNLSDPVTYGPDRRTGANAVRIMKLNFQAGSWEPVVR